MSDSTPIYWHSLADGGSPALYARVPSVKPAVQTGSPGAGQRTFVTGPPPFYSPTVRWTLLGDGAMGVAWDDQYAITIFGRNGVPQRVISRGLVPRKVGEREKEFGREARRTSMSNGGGINIRMNVTNGQATRSIGSGAPPPRAELERTLASMTFAETVPVIASVTTDAHGRLWIARTGDKDPTAPGPIDIVDANGAYVGTVAAQPLPSAFSRGGRAAYIETDEELGFAKVVVRQLPTGW